MKRVFGTFEAIFDLIYLFTALILGIYLILSDPGDLIHTLVGIMAIVLVSGDAFHLIPRIAVIISGNEKFYRKALGRGKQIASITMTMFYIFLWHIGLSIYSLDNMNFWSIIIYLLAVVRILLCLLPNNKWDERFPPVKWGILRNIPFFLQGITVAIMFFINRNVIQDFSLIWLAIILSFGFYLPVVLWANKNPKIGMLMLPKTCTYIWLLVMFT